MRRAAGARSTTYLVRGTAEEGSLDALRAQSSVVGVYSDPPIEPMYLCRDSPALGTDADVARLLETTELHTRGMDGRGVFVAIVDKGINLDYLVARGKSPALDAERSWVPRDGLTPGKMPVDHGTMCAFNVGIAAPRCTLLDIAVMAPVPGGQFAGYLSDALRAYRHLVDLMEEAEDAGHPISLVVNNSWGMYNASWDLPIGDPGNYSDNPEHPFNRIVAELEDAGADILFAAGNCGADCPYANCGATSNAIYGANGHPAVLCVAGADITGVRTGFSTIGPGRLKSCKPDIMGYTHFHGSGVTSVDSGTSAATPVVAGVVAALRSRRPYDPNDRDTYPEAIRDLITTLARKRDGAEFDHEYGFGLINGGEVARAFPRVVPGGDAVVDPDTDADSPGIPLPGGS